MKRTIDFTRGSIIRAIILFSIPLILGELLQTLYNSVDAIVVGNFVNEQALAAVTVCGTVTTMIINFFNGMSIGSNVVVAMATGHGDREEIKLAVRGTFSFGIVLGLSMSVLGVLFAPQLLQIAGTQESYFASALLYLRIYHAGLVFTVIYNNAAGILRAIGRSDTPFRILVITCGMNIVLDLLFTGCLGMGITGVAVATVVAQATSAYLSYHAIRREVEGKCIDFHEMLQEARIPVLQSIRVGFAAGLQSALIGLSNVFIMRYINLFSVNAVAGIGVAQRLDRFVLLPAKTFGITMTTFVGQNMGAGQYRRIKKGLHHCAATALGITLFLSVIVYFFAEQCTELFSQEPEVIAVSVRMMHILVPMYWALSWKEVYVGMLRGCGRNLWPAVLNIVGMIVLRQIYLAVEMSKNPMIDYIYYCYPVTWVITCGMLALYYLGVRRHLLPDDANSEN